MAVTEKLFKEALHDAFMAGHAQGADWATSYERGDYPSQTKEEAFDDVFEDWDTGHNGNSAVKQIMDGLTKNETDT